MDLDDIHRAKHALQSDLLRLIQAFEDETKLSIRDVRLARVDEVGNAKGRVVALALVVEV